MVVVSFLIFVSYAARAAQAIPIGSAWTALLLLLLILAAGEVLHGPTRLLTALAGDIQALGACSALRGLTGADTRLLCGLLLRLRAVCPSLLLRCLQSIHDQP
jgi:hypothetical protein